MDISITPPHEKGYIEERGPRTTEYDAIPHPKQSDEDTIQKG